MLTKSFEKLFSTDNLLEKLEHYKETKEYLLLKEMVHSGEFVEALDKGYVPEPLVSFEIPKSNGEMRQIAMATTSSKLVQKVIADALGVACTFSDKSYAFRKGKGTLKAAARTKDFLKKYSHVAKADIDDFFDSIDHDKLMLVLKAYIKDAKVLLLLSVFLKNGMLKQNKWVDKEQGVYQGDTLSPVLSNLYLHSFDVALEKHNIDFVRYADDMVFFAKSEKKAKLHLLKASAYLHALGLSFGEDKSYLASKRNGFEFLGLRFKEEAITMDNARFMKKLSTLSQKTKKKDLEKSIDFFNQSTRSIKAYYLKVLTDETQFMLMEEHIDSILIHKVMKAKKSKSINRKGLFVQLLVGLDSFSPATADERQQDAHALIARAYEAIALEKPLETAQKILSKKKTSFLQEQIKSSEIILNAYGLYASVSKGKLVVKEYGKVVNKVPINWVTRVMVMTKGASLSTALVFECAKRKIAIDFIDRQKPYAQITYFSNISNELHLKQLDLKNSDAGLKVAKSIVRAKIKNQINLIKYHARYREETDMLEFVKLEKSIKVMEKLYKLTKKAEDVPMLMGYEGSVSVAYWKAFGVIIGDESFKRVTKDAPDVINQALNYGYAFIYQRVQSALLKVGVNIYHSFLHVSQANKPTLVFDMVEPFRQPVVDREIISILNLGTQINSNKGRLNKKSIKVISQNIQERLATPTRWRKGKYKLTTIIEEQALEMAHTIKGTKSKFKGFVVRY